MDCRSLFIGVGHLHCSEVLYCTCPGRRLVLLSPAGFVTLLRVDFMIASELRGDSGLRRYFDCDCAVIFLVPIILPPIVLTGLPRIVHGL